MLPPFVDEAWLAAHSGPSGPIVVHVGTTTDGRDPHDAYRHARLPDARYVSLDDDLAGPPAPIVGRHPLPTLAAFGRVLDRLGIGAESDVVAYDDVTGPARGAHASRFVWMLRLLGHSAALLDRGDQPVPAADSAVQPAPEWADRAEAKTPPWQARDTWPPGGLADADEVAAHLSAGGIVVDSRSAERHAGLVEPIDATAGHIPGALNLPFTGNLGNDGRLRPIDELATRFAVLDSDPEPIVSCGSGVTACHNALAIEATGRPLPRVYVGSWSGWSTDPARPIATGDA